MNAKTARARRQYVAAARLARDKRAPAAERAAARGLMDRLLKRHPEFSAIQPDREAPPRSLRSVDERELGEYLTEIKRWTGDNVEPRPVWDALATYRTVSELYDLPWNAVCEAVINILTVVRRSVDEARAGMGQGFIFTRTEDDGEAPPARPQEEAPARPEEPAEEPAEEPQDARAALPPPEEPAPPPKPLPEPGRPLYERDPDDRASAGRDRVVRPRFAWPGWPRARRTPPYDGSWWDPWTGPFGRWMPPTFDLSRNLRRAFGEEAARVAEWMPMVLWVTACELAGRRHDDFGDDLGHEGGAAARLAAPHREPERRRDRLLTGPCVGINLFGGGVCGRPALETGGRCAHHARFETVVPMAWP